MSFCERASRKLFLPPSGPMSSHKWGWRCRLIPTKPGSAPLRTAFRCSRASSIVPFHCRSPLVFGFRWYFALHHWTTDPDRGIRKCPSAWTQCIETAQGEPMNPIKWLVGNANTEKPGAILLKFRWDFPVPARCASPTLQSVVIWPFSWTRWLVRALFGFNLLPNILELDILLCYSCSIENHLKPRLNQHCIMCPRSSSKPSCHWTSTAYRFLDQLRCYCRLQQAVNIVSDMLC